MGFTTQRGRPKTRNCTKDTGTPELIMKRLHHVTSETIDLCLAKHIITPVQHWCAVHLRWLYTLKFGAPSVCVRDLTDAGGRETAYDDPQWRAEREEEYRHALEGLRNICRIEKILDICVHNYRPAFLRNRLVKNSRLCIQPRDENELCSYIAALDTLCTMWKVRDSAR